eukprot:Skav205659  [mRNA]  locus=scaffold458:257725:258063:+ [translate_table: standard]
MSAPLHRLFRGRLRLASCCWVLGVSKGWNLGRSTTFAVPRRDLLSSLSPGLAAPSRSGSSVASDGSMATLAFIADTTTPNGKALLQLVSETDATENLGHFQSLATFSLNWHH